MRLHHSAIQNILKLGFRPRCPLCQRWAIATFCPDCLRQLQDCQVQSRQDQVFAWGNYTGTLKRAISVLKYEGGTEIARPLGQWLAQAWLQPNHQQRYVVVPIPLHRDRKAQRGYNQAELIARSFCNTTGLPLRSQGLTRQRATQAQFGLTITKRRQNLAQAFALGPDLQTRRPQHPVLLLDDIYTTGATATAATQTLQQSGIHVFGIVAVAQAQRFTRSETPSV